MRVNPLEKVEIHQCFISGGNGGFALQRTRFPRSRQLLSRARRELLALGKVVNTDWYPHVSREGAIIKFKHENMNLNKKTTFIDRSLVLGAS